MIHFGRYSVFTIIGEEDLWSLSVPSSPLSLLPLVQKNVAIPWPSWDAPEEKRRCLGLVDELIYVTVTPHAEFAAAAPVQEWLPGVFLSPAGPSHRLPELQDRKSHRGVTCGAWYWVCVVSGGETGFGRSR